MSLKLGVNIDHIATLRQARRAPWPDPLDAAAVCLATGADYIVVHLRKDERHINGKDVANLCQMFPGKIHLECSYTPELEKAALKYRPFSVCIVPEEPGEITTTGGQVVTSGKSSNGEFKWDVRDAYGNDVGSGVYFVLVSTGNSKHGARGRLVVIR